MKYVVALTALLLFAGSAFAQSDAQRSSQRRTLIDFRGEHDVIEGTLDAPDEDPIVARSPAMKSGKLIRVRDNFRSQVLSSVPGL